MIRSPPSSNTRSYTSVASCTSTTPTSVQNRKAKDDLMSLSLDIKCPENPNASVTDKVIADFIFIELGIKKSEITGIVGGGIGHRAVKVETVKPIDVEKRFGDNLSYKRDVGERTWICSIRNGRNASPIRFFNVPRWITNEELIGAIHPFAKTISGMENEVFGKFHDPRLAGLNNGHRRALIINTSTVPDFIVIGEKKIRIYHRNQIPKCFACRREGHIKINCPTTIKERGEKPEEGPTDPQSHREREEIPSDSEEFVVFEDIVHQDLPMVTKESAEKPCDVGTNEDAYEKPQVVTKDLTDVGDLLNATENWNITDDNYEDQGHMKRKTPASQPTPIVKHTTNGKKKGRTDKELIPKTIITRSGSATS